MSVNLSIDPSIHPSIFKDSTILDTMPEEPEYVNLPPSKPSDRPKPNSRTTKQHALKSHITTCLSRNMSSSGLCSTSMMSSGSVSCVKRLPHACHSIHTRHLFSVTLQGAGPPDWSGGSWIPLLRSSSSNSICSTSFSCLGAVASHRLIDREPPIISNPCISPNPWRSRKFHFSGV